MASNWQETYEKLKKRKEALDAISRNDIVSTLPKKSSVSTTSTKKKDEEERTWFDTGLFDDGYDMWDITKTILGTTQDVKENLTKGVARIGEGLVDTGAFLAGGVGKLFGADEFAEDTKKFIARDLVEEKKIGEGLSTTVSPSGHFFNIADTLLNKGEDVSVFGDKSDSLIQSAGQLAGTIGLQAVGVPWWATTGVTSFGGETQQAFQQDATYGEAGVSGLVSAAAEVLTEKLSGGISFGGKTLDDFILKPLTDKIANKTARTLINLGTDAAGEGFEELLTEVISNVGQKLTYEDDKTWGEMLTSEEAMDSYLEAIIGGAVLGGGFGTVRAANSIKTGRDYKTGLTDNEQSVINSEIAKRTEGKELTSKQKKKIEAEVREDLEKGYISTDTIESTLGGDTYNTLKSTRDNKTNLETQIKELENKPNAEITVGEMERLHSLREQLEAIDTNTLETQLQSEIGTKIKSDGYLQRSYQEKAKRSQEFTYEATEKDSQYRKGVMESTKGKLNDTTRSHETAEALVKLSEDRQMQYKFTNNAELTKLGLVPEGKTANGLYVVDKDGSREILVNTDSKKYIEAVLVHETAHDFQTTSPETYSRLQDITREFAEAQNEYSRVYSEVAGMYKNVEGVNIEEEVTSRLLEDYLGNKDFISNLSTKEPTVVRKIIDEIKYLVKKFTAGSPEARKLVELQHKLEETYKEAYKQTKATETTEGTKYSLTDNSGRKLTKEQQEYFKDSKARDDDGSLTTVYHTSPNAGFTVFDGNKGEGYYRFSKYGADIAFFTDNKVMSESYARKQGTDGTYEGYLNLKNPLIVDAEGRNWNRVTTERSQEIIDRYSKLTDIEKDYLMDLASWEDSRLFASTLEDANRDVNTLKKTDMGEDVEALASAYKKLKGTGFKSNVTVDFYDTYMIAQEDFSPEAIEENSIRTLTTNDIVEKALEDGSYDGVIIKNVVDFGPQGGILRAERKVGNDYVIFDSNQFKNADNTNPTTDKDIRYSLTDNTGRELSEQQIEYFKDSKVRDEEGRLLEVYHGTKTKGINIFNYDPNRQTGTDFGKAYYFTTDYIKAKGYQYDADADPRVKEHQSQERAARKKMVDAGFTEKARNEYVEWLDTHSIIDIIDNEQDIIKRVDEIGGETKKLYLNLTNPLEVDANGEYYHKVYPEYFKTARANGNDGIIVKNVIDNPRGEHRPIDVYIAFNENQIKNVDNLNPTENPDIRYSLSEDKKTYDVTDFLSGSNLKEKGMEIPKYIKVGPQKMLYEYDSESDQYNRVLENDNHYWGYKEPLNQYFDYYGGLFDEVEIVDNQNPTDNPDIRYSLSVEDYGMSHRPSTDYGDGSNFEENMPDVFEHPEWYFYGGNDARAKKAYRESFEALKRVRNNPEGEITIYRATIGDTINEGDWITPSKTYAEWHNYSNLDGKGNILELKVKAKDIRFGGDDLNEFGYFPNGTENFSLSNESDITPAPLRNKTTAEDIRLQEIAPIKETVQTEQQQAPMNTTDIDYAPAPQELVEQQGREEFNTLDDTDMPIEVEEIAPTSEKLTPTDSLFDTRDYEEVGSKKVNAYQYDNPEVRPYFQQAAREMLTDLDNSTRGERFIIGDNTQLGDNDYYYSGTKRATTEDIAELLDGMGGKYKYTYAEIRKGLNAIIKDEGAENNAVSKRIEFYLDKRLREGYTDIDGYEIPADEEYLDMLRAKGITDYYNSIPLGEAPVSKVNKPVDNVSNSNIAERIAPIRRGYEIDDNLESALELDKDLKKAKEKLNMMREYNYTENEIAEQIEEIDSLERFVSALIEDGSDQDLKDYNKYLQKERAKLESMEGNMLYALEIEAQREFVKDLESGRSALIEDAMYVPKTKNIAPLRAEAIRPAPDKDSHGYRLIRVKTDAELQTETNEEIAKILTEEPKVENNRNKRKWAILKANVLDKGLVFEDVSLKHKNRELMGKWDYTLTSEARGQNVIGNGHYEYDPYSKTTKQVSKSLNDIRAEVDNTGLTSEFYEYIYHKHNVDRMRLEGRYEGMENKPVFGYNVTAEDSQQVVIKYETQHPEFITFAQDVYDYLDADRQVLVDNGVISQETADLWKSMYPHYVPIRRAGHTGNAINVPLDTGRTGVNAPIKKATGGNQDILPLFDTMAQRTLQTHRAAAKNSFGVELKNTIGTTINSQATNIDEVIDSVEAQEELLQEGKNGQKPTFTVFEDGEKITFEITQDMYDALKPLSDSSILSKTITPLNKMSNFHRGLLTQYNLFFALRNGIKDAQDILINSQHSAKTYAKVPEATAQLVKKGYWYQEYMLHGGEQNSYFDSVENTFKTENTGIKKILDLPPLKQIAQLNDFIERVPRLAEYIASREAGRSVEVSMLDAARVTTNFKAGGNLSMFLNRNGFTFTNAPIQGAMQQVRNVREANANGIRGWANLATKFAIAGLPAMILNSLLWDDDDEYEELSDYVKQNYYIVAKNDNGTFIRIPKGRTLAVIQEGFEQMKHLVTGDDEADLKTFIDLFLTNLAPNNPVDNNVLSPIKQVLNNKTWYDEDLVPTRLQDLPAAEQYDESTDSFSRWLGEKTNISPMKINYLLDQYTGVVGDIALPMMTPEAKSDADTFGEHLLAPLKSTFTTNAVMNNQNVTDFYDKSEELTTEAKKSNATDEDVLRNKYINSVKAEMNELYAEKREIQNSDLSNSEKYNRVLEVQKQINELSKEALNEYKNVDIYSNYATAGDRQYRLTDDGEWQKINDKQLEKQNNVTSSLGITPNDYWSNKEEYDYAYENPSKYALANAIADYSTFRQLSSELYDIKADKDESGKSISGSRKEKVFDYINNLDLDFEQRIMLAKLEYPSYDEYNYEIIEYLNNRDDISYEQMVSILTELGFTVKKDGTIVWD